MKDEPTKGEEKEEKRERRSGAFSLSPLPLSFSL